jgi:hypothetical protein
MRAVVKSVTNVNLLIKQEKLPTEPYNLPTSYYRTSSRKKPNINSNFLSSSSVFLEAL